jgi:uncharacterized protein
MQMTIQIEIDINPTENEEKVKKALFNLFGDLAIEIKPLQRGSLLIAQAKGQEPLSTLRNVLARDRIRDAARKALHNGMRSQSLTFYLNKQVAFAGHASFSEAEAESPLGPIKVIVECENPLEIIDWLAPRTSKP